MITINVIAATRECDDISPVQMNEEMTILSGKFGGTCYAADGYETIKTQPVEKALNRAQSTADRGHHSVFQHCMITMEIQCSKIIAMLLNSIGISNTSEKSARYTKMKPQTEREEFLYQKWRDIFFEKINEVYQGMFTEKEADKLAYENARYMISVFCPTSMVYSLPFRNIFYVLDWTSSMLESLGKLDGDFNKRLSEELLQLHTELLRIVGGKENFHDNKNEYFRFMPVQATGEKDDDNQEYFGDVYTAKFLASFAQVAQEQRHRTLRVKINFAGDNPEEYGFYVPELIRETPFEDEWLSDMRSIGEVYPQGVLVSVTEQGLFEDFVLKSKERMCGRAQLEIMRITEQLTERFVSSRQNLSTANRKRLEMVTEQDKACARCGFADFVCKEGCKWGKKNALIRKI